MAPLRTKQKDSKEEHSVLNPRTTSYEFSGPWGTFFIMLVVPIIIYGLYFGCSEETGGCPPNLSLAISSIATIGTQSVDVAGITSKLWGKLWDAEAMLYYLAWYLFCVICWAVLPGEYVEGRPMRNGQVKRYKANAFQTFLLSLALASAYIIQFGPDSFTFVYHKWVGFITASIIMAFIQAGFVYVMSFRPGKLLALGGNTGNHVYDFFIGRELNPSIGSFDIKSFNELRPSLITWAFIDISMACEQAVRRGGWGNVTDSMWIVLIGQIWYIGDALWNEPALFTTMDIISDGFGYMLSVGVLSWIPFTFSVQARYLVFRQRELGHLVSGMILLMHFVGYWIFRESNNEKNEFRNGKNPKNLKFLTTNSGSKLLISGWWGLSRHPNYLGDLLMALSWSLPTGFETPITYFYITYFTILLVHRERRDDDHCAKKYRDDWKKYKALVPYKIVPYVY
ncbi:hypothetical protein D9758_013196 [Tetrapyrgos nigripes]|uniref:Delta(14)-sterol reductase n=1 Tax=Tetrapyrgos nigripes TaxID=182062 RepID=A0A8H5FS24_9AGAR|nr:hypothetical protein D9758_013196 [Tetrapyrgos nigripes]